MHDLINTTTSFSFMGIRENKSKKLCRSLIIFNLFSLSRCTAMVPAMGLSSLLFLIVLTLILLIWFWRCWTKKSFFLSCVYDYLCRLLISGIWLLPEFCGKVAVSIGRIGSRLFICRRINRFIYETLLETFRKFWKYRNDFL